MNENGDRFYLASVGNKRFKCDANSIGGYVADMLQFVNMSDGDSLVVLELTEEEFKNANPETIMSDYYGEAVW